MFAKNINTVLPMRNLDNFGNILQWTSFLFFIFRTLVVDNLIYFKIKK